MVSGGWKLIPAILLSRLEGGSSGLSFVYGWVDVLLLLDLLENFQAKLLVSKTIVFSLYL